MRAVLGTAKNREEVSPPSSAHDLEDVMLRDWRGSDVRLGDVWSDNPAVLVFLRHYG
jgi:prostamide/prostaglandin F2alpha synthase